MSDVVESQLGVSSAFCNEKQRPFRYGCRLCTAYTSRKQVLSTESSFHCQLASVNDY